MSDHHINLFFSDEDQCWIADLPDFEFCSAAGPTPEEALAELLVAKREWIEVAKEEGIPIPKPAYRPIIYQAAIGA